MAISIKTQIYKITPVDVNENRYVIKNTSIKAKPMMISRGLEDLKIKKKGNTQNTIHAYILSQGYLGNI